MSVNKVILIGNVGKDPDVRYLDTGIAVATFSLATTDRAYTLQNGTQVPERTEWHNIVLWRGLAQTAEKYVRKGGYVPQAQAVSRQQVSAQTAPQQQQGSDNSLTDDLPF